MNKDTTHLTQAEYFLRATAHLAGPEAAQKMWGLIRRHEWYQYEWDGENLISNKGDFTMPKPRGEVTRSTTPEKATFSPLSEPSITIAAWCPDENAQLPPEQVHLIHTIPSLEEYPIIMRFKSPHTLGFLIEELARYRREVWPDAEPVNTE